MQEKMRGMQWSEKKRRKVKVKTHGLC